MFLRFNDAFVVPAVISVLILGPSGVAWHQVCEEMQDNTAEDRVVSVLAALPSDQTFEDDDDSSGARKIGVIGIDALPRPDANRQQARRVSDVLSSAPKNSPPASRS